MCESVSVSEREKGAERLSVQSIFFGHPRFFNVFFLKATIAAHSYFVSLDHQFIVSIVFNKRFLFSICNLQPYNGNMVRNALSLPYKIFHLFT